MTDSLESALKAMITAGENPKPEILERVKAFREEAISRLIEIATDEGYNDLSSDDPRVFANLHAIKVLGELRAVQAIEPLLPYVEWDDDDWLASYIPEFFGHIGEPAIAALEKILADESRTIHTHARISESLVRIAQEYPELRSRVIEILTQYLDSAHTNTPEHETRAGFIIGDLGDLRATEALPAIHRAFDEDRVDQQVINLDAVKRKMEGRPYEASDLDEALERWDSQELELFLRCTQCGRERKHKVGTLFVDLGTMERRERGEKTRHDEFIITRRIVCPKCGAIDKYEFGSSARLTATADLLQRKVRKKPLENQGPVRYIRFGLSDGRQMHPREAMETLRRESNQDPKNADLRVRLAQVLRFLGYYDEAIAEYKAALNFDRENIEAYLNLGTTYGVCGDLKSAAEMLERALRLETELQASPQDHAFNQAVMRKRLDQVKRGEKLDESILHEFGSEETISGIPSQDNSPSARVGRNDPCPCGSGKKYKRCHGR